VLRRSSELAPLSRILATETVHCGGYGAGQNRGLTSRVNLTQESSEIEADLSDRNLQNSSSQRMLFEPTVTVEELLASSRGCLVYFLVTFHQAESSSKLTMKGFRVISHYFQSTASCRPSDPNVLTITWPPGLTACMTWRT
jgi:hypothetical protein